MLLTADMYVTQKGHRVRRAAPSKDRGANREVTYDKTERLNFLG